ncbi:MAG TPA: DUF1059 domain-containing protein [Candidatus Nitrosopolaris sp.]|nr:DUF1059 domain-containing protein [Candidatus Nitrosopolaris sp.]
MFSLACRDAGVMDCDYVDKGMTKEEFWRDGTEHLIKVHDIKAGDKTPQSHKQYIRQS